MSGERENELLPRLYQCGCGNWVQTYAERDAHVAAHCVGVKVSMLQEVYLPAMRERLEEDAQLPEARTMPVGDVLEAIRYEYFSGFDGFIRDESDRRYLASIGALDGSAEP